MCTGAWKSLHETAVKARERKWGEVTRKEAAQAANRRYQLFGQSATPPCSGGRLPKQTLRVLAAASRRCYTPSALRHFGFDPDFVGMGSLGKIARGDQGRAADISPHPFVSGSGLWSLRDAFSTEMRENAELGALVLHMKEAR